MTNGSCKKVQKLNFLLVTMMLRALASNGRPVPGATVFSRASPLVAAIVTSPAPPSALAASRSGDGPTWKNGVMAAKPIRYGSLARIIGPTSRAA